MLRAMIVDDEAPARSELRFLLEQTGKIGSIIEASRTAIMPSRRSMWMPSTIL